MQAHRPHTSLFRVLRAAGRTFSIGVLACVLCLTHAHGHHHAASAAGAGCDAAASTAGLTQYQAYAQQQGGYTAAQMGCLISLWQAESGWNPAAVEDQPTKYGPPTYAYGIPQALPKYTGGEWGAYSEADWQAQIRWGIAYIGQRYGGDPCTAWSHEQANGWY